jgi:hypothetical protein
MAGALGLFGGHVRDRADDVRASSDESLERQEQVASSSAAPKPAMIIST